MKIINILNLKKKEKYKFKNFFYYNNINSFDLTLLCSYVCYTNNLEDTSALDIFHKTIDFISSININDHFYSYDNGVFKINNKNYDKKSKNELFEKVNNEMNNMNTFLINSTYDIFKNKIYAFIELIEESKKAIYYLNKKNYFLFIYNQ